MTVGAPVKQPFMAQVIQVLARMSYFINLLGLKIPLGLMARASHARHVLAGLLAIYVPFSLYCHAILLAQVREAEYGLLIWHILIAMWITIPLLVVGSVILSHVRQAKPLQLFTTAFVGMACFHKFAVPILQPSSLGTVLLQVLFLTFEDGAVAGWVWCLYHVVRLQDHVKITESKRECPIEMATCAEDTALVVGNAPNVLDAPLGDIMDGFQSVCRFNTYNMTKPEFTGSKVSYHFCNGRNLPAAREVKAVLPLFNASLTHACYLFMPHMEEAADINANLMGSKANLWVVDEGRILELRKKIKCNFWQIPSSGMVAIDAFLSKRPEVALHGFNFFSGKKIHYFEESPLQLITSWLERFVTHNPPREKVWVQSVVDEGRAYFLSEGKRSREHTTSSEEETSGSDEKNSKLEGKEARKRHIPRLLEFLRKDLLPSQFSM
jgi:hypothetical protein